MSNTELAQRVSLTPAPCLRRVKRLEADGVITGYRAVIDPAAAGQGSEVTVSVEVVVNDQVSLEKLEAQIVEFDEVIEMVLPTTCCTSWSKTPTPTNGS